MFDSLREKLDGVFKTLKGKGLHKKPERKRVSELAPHCGNPRFPLAGNEKRPRRNSTSYYFDEHVGEP